MNKILIAAYNETFRQSSDPVYAHTPMRNVGKLRTFNPKLKDSAGGEVNKQNKRKLYAFRHMWIRQALKPANDTRDQALNYANNIEWNTNHNKLLTKTITLVSNRSI